MTRKLLSLSSLLLTVAAVGCHRPGATFPSAPASMHVVSSSFPNGGQIPPRCSATGGNVSPALSWTDVPAATQAFALVMQDPDAPGEPFVHWMVYAIHPTVRSIHEGQIPPAALEGTNDAGKPGYFGPKPPSGTHRYIFRIYALDQELAVGPGVKKEELVKAIGGHTLAMGELIGVYSAGKRP